MRALLVACAFCIAAALSADFICIEDTIVPEGQVDELEQLVSVQDQELDASMTEVTKPRDPPTWKNPDPRLVVNTRSTNHEYSGRVRTGLMSVQLIPGDPKSPLIEIGVEMVSADNPSAPVLFVHCGGPGSGKDCALDLDQGFSKRYNIIGVDQRGIGSSKPNLNCDASTFHKPTDGTGKFPFKPDNTPMVGGCFSDTGLDKSIGQETFIEQAARATKGLEARNKKCYKSKKFQILHNGRVYNYLNFAGTASLAWDLEAIRKAVGAKELNLLGLSYGTQVVGTYATMFPHNTGKIVMDSTMPPDQDTLSLGKGALRANEQVKAYVKRLCSAFPDICPWKGDDADMNLDKLLEMARNGKLSAPTVKEGTLFYLSPGLLTNYIQICISGQLSGDNDHDAKKNAEKCLPKFDKLLNGPNREEAVAEVLNTPCTFTSGTGITASWKEHGFCAGAGQFGLDFLPDTVPSSTWPCCDSFLVGDFGSGFCRAVFCFASCQNCG